jgi:hypothetical protein
LAGPFACPRGRAIIGECNLDSFFPPYFNCVIDLFSFGVISLPAAAGGEESRLLVVSPITSIIIIVF